MSSVLGVDASFASNSSPKQSLRFIRLQLACSSIFTIGSEDKAIAIWSCLLPFSTDWFHELSSGYMLMPSWDHVNETQLYISAGVSPTFSTCVQLGYECLCYLRANVGLFLVSWCTFDF